MPNWCNTSVGFYTTKDKKEELTRFHDEIEKLETTPSAIENDFGNWWLGNVWYHFMKTDPSFIRGARGLIYYISDVSDFDDTHISFEINTETAWVFEDSFWETILNKCFPNIEMSFIAEECGCQYYEKRDNIGLFPDEYIIDACINGDCLTEYVSCVEDIPAILKDHGYNKDFDLSLIKDGEFEANPDDYKEYGLSSEDDYISIHKFEEV